MAWRVGPRKQRGFVQIPQLRLFWWGGARTKLLFDLPLTTSLVPTLARGSSTPTFTRATTATVTDWEGVIRTAISGEARFHGARRVANLLLKTDFSASWTQVTCDKATGVSDPEGGTTAVTFTATAISGQFYQGVTLASAAFDMRNSLWIRRRTGTGNISMTGGDNVLVNITSTISSSWQRISVPVTTGGNAGGTTYFLNVLFATSGDAIDVWHPQMENVAGQSNQNPSEYVSVGVLSAPYHGAGVDGVKWFDTECGNTVASNVVTEATGAAISTATLKGYLAEGARTNTCLRSQSLGTTWSPTNVTVLEDQYTAPDGTTTMDRITVDAGSAVHYLNQGSVATTAGKTTFSCYLRYVNHRWVNVNINDGTNNIAGSFDLLNGATGAKTIATDTVTITPTEIDDVYRCTVTGTTVTGTANLNLIANNSDSASAETWNAAGTEIVGAWGGQVEVGAFASSYIPTTTASVTRNADVLTYALAGNISNAAGTAFVEFTLDNAASSAQIVNTHPYIAGGQKLAYFDGTNAHAVSPTLSAQTLTKGAVVWSGATAAVFQDGGNKVTGAYDGNWSAATISILSSASGVYAKNVKIWNRPLSDAAVAAL